MAQTTAILRVFSTPSSPRLSIPLSNPTFRSHSRNPTRIPIAHSSTDGRSSSLYGDGWRIALRKPIIHVAGRVRNSVSSAPELESAVGVFDHLSPLFAVDDSDDVAEFCEMALIRTRLRLVVGLLSRISRDPEVAKVVSLGYYAQEFLSGYEFADNDAVEIKRIQEALSAAGDDDGEILAVQQFLSSRCNSDPGLVQLFEIFDANFTAGDITVLALAHMAKMTAEALMFPAMEYFADEMGKFSSLISRVEGQEQKGKRQSLQKKTLGEDLAGFAERLLNRDDEMRRWMPIRNAQIIRNLSSTTAAASVPGNSERWGSDYYIYNSIFGESSSNNSPGLGSDTLTGSDSAVKEEGKSSSLELDVSQKYKDLWVQCENCYGLNYKKFLKTKMNICEHCGFHLKMSSTDRIDLLIDPGTWDPMDEGMVSVDPIEFHSEDEPYKDRIDSYQRKTGLTEAVQTGVGQMNGIPVALGVMDFQFMGGSMGSVVGEKITRLIEHASSKSLPLVIVCASGGARMQEGSMSLMQMAKISAALHDYQTNKKLFYVPVLSSPTTGGVTASFGMLGDIIIAEPNAYIAFAGKRVIEQTLNKTVPEGSQVAEFLFEKGLFDLIVPRNILKSVLIELLMFHAFLPLNQNTVET